jgi:glycosyltransferase involved in cell wall biosynthesis
MRVGILSFNAQAGDAVGNQIAEKLAFFLERGADVRLFVESGQRLHPAVRGHAHFLARPEPKREAWQFLTTCDLVIAEYSQAYPLLGLLPLLVGGKPRLLVDYHGVTPPELWGCQNGEALEKGIRQRGLVWCADAALTHSRFTRGELLKHTGYPQERLLRLGYPVDRDRFAPGAPRTRFREELGLGGVSLLLFVGRLAPNKRVPVLVEALAHLHDLSPPVHAVVVGETGDLYQREAHLCRERARALGVADRLHFLGRVSDDRLADAYRSADLFVMPSRHEGFCIPVLEAMACGLPVLAARATALPETVGAGGLTFHPDDAADLARQVRRVLKKGTQRNADATDVHRFSNEKGETQCARLSSPIRADPLDRRSTAFPSLRVAVVAFRYGSDFVGGAETSLRTMAEVLHQAGHEVEVFATCTRAESDWSDQLPEGTALCGGVLVHRFRLDAHDRARHLESVRAILQSGGAVSERTEQDYLVHSIHSPRLIEALRGRIDRLDAVLVGPYLFGLTFDVCREFPDKTLLVPCFHDEPFARLAVWRAAYREVGGILYHSEEEQELAQSTLGLSHPRAVCVGTHVATATSGQAAGLPATVGGRPYVVYVGRYSAHKRLPLLLDHARRYHTEYPDRFTFVFLGQGEETIPREPWACDLGFVHEEAKRDLLAGAAALVQLSRSEALSLAALEAWAQGTPVLADGRCEVLCGHLRRSGGGRAVDGYEGFAAALNDLWAHPRRWQEMGRKGQDYVRSRYGSADAFRSRLEEAVRGLAVPLAEAMRAQGLQRAARFDRAAWRQQFGLLVEELLDAPARPHREQVEVRARVDCRTVAAGLETVFVPVRVVNRGTHAVVHEGPGQTVVRCRVVDAAGQPWGPGGADTQLPGLLMPGRALSAAVRVPVPDRPGAYRVGLWAERADPAPAQGRQPSESWLPLFVEGGERPVAPGCCTSLLETVQAALAEADRTHRLPDDYTDVCQGLLASWKRRLKRKLLGNFKQAYVDVLSRQQSAFNRQVLTPLQELAECCAILDHACSRSPALADDLLKRVPTAGAGDVTALLKELLDQLAESRRRCAALEERLARLEEREANRPETDPGPGPPDVLPASSYP